MFNEVKAGMIELTGNAVFVRNLSATLFATMIIVCGLAELQSQNYSISDRQSITNISNSSSMKIIVRRK